MSNTLVISNHQVNSEILLIELADNGLQVTYIRTANRFSVMKFPVNRSSRLVIAVEVHTWSVGTVCACRFIISNHNRTTIKESIVVLAGSLGA